MAASKICFVNKSLRDPVPDKVKIDKDKLMGFILAMCDELERCDVSKDGIRINPARGLYLGSAGLGYSYLKAWKNVIENYITKKNYVALMRIGMDYYPEAISKIRDCMEEYSVSVARSMISCPKRRRALWQEWRGSFMFGRPGCYAAAAAVCFQLSNPLGVPRPTCIMFTKDSYRYMRLYSKAYEDLIRVDYNHPKGGDNLTHGRAGYVMGALYLRANILPDMAEKHLPLTWIYDMLDIMYCSCRAWSDSRIVPSSGADKQVGLCPLMVQCGSNQYFGMAKGLSGVLLAMLCTPGYLESRPLFVARDIRLSVDYLLSIQSSSGVSPGNIPRRVDRITGRPREVRNPKSNLVQWCHGAAGVAHLFARAYLVWAERKYLKAALACGEAVWKDGLLKKGAGLCHGIAGNGYVFLMLYRLTKDKKHLNRAVRFMTFLMSKTFMMHKLTTKQTHPTSLFEGVPGTLCFLSDLMNPTEACFPFFDIFGPIHTEMPYQPDR